MVIPGQAPLTSSMLAAALLSSLFLCHCRWQLRLWSSLARPRSPPACWLLPCCHLLFSVTVGGCSGCGHPRPGPAHLQHVGCCPVVLCHCRWQLRLWSSPARPRSPPACWLLPCCHLLFSVIVGGCSGCGHPRPGPAHLQHVGCCPVVISCSLSL